MPVVIETRRLSLRRQAAGDAPFILRLLNDADFLHHIGDRGVRTVEDAEAYGRRRLVAGPAVATQRRCMRNPGAVPGGLLLAAFLLTGLLTPASGAAQSFLAVHGERWTLDSGHLGAVEARGGVGIEMGKAGGGRSTGLLASWVPEGDVEPGWFGLQARRGFSGAIGPLRLSAEAGLAGVNMRVGNRHRAIEVCRAQGGCSFEAADYESGWGMGGTIAGTAAVRFGSSLGVVLRHSRMRLLLGANGGETLQGWSLGLSLGLD